MGGYWRFPLHIINKHGSANTVSFGPMKTCFAVFFREMSLGNCDRNVIPVAIRQSLGLCSLGSDDLQDFSTNTDHATGFDNTVTAIFNSMASPGEIETVADPLEKGSGMPGFCGRVPAAWSQQEVTQTPWFQCPANRFSQNSQWDVSAVLPNVGGT